MNDEWKAKLVHASSLDETKEILKGEERFDAERVWQEIENHRSSRSDKLDLEELDAVSGGADRDWVKDGCAATCEDNSWCWSNDKCQIWDVTYSNFWTRCPDGHQHEYDSNHVCLRCGHKGGYYDFKDG